MINKIKGKLSTKKVSKTKAVKPLAGLASLKKAIKKKAPVKAKETKTALVETPAIKTAFADKSMAQIYSSGLEFAFIGPEGIQCHSFAYCKDFLQDAIQATLHKKTSSIWGFSYDYKVNPPLDLENTRMAVRYKGRATLEEEVKNSVRFMNEIESELGFASTTVHDGGKHANAQTYVFISDKKWMHAPPLISMYSLLLRVGLNYKDGGWLKHLEAGKFIGNNDASYISTGIKGIKDIVKKKIENIFADKMEDNYPSSVSIGTMHDQSGIVAYSRGMSGALVQNWKSK
jgi:hypothetical protein